MTFQNPNVDKWIDETVAWLKPDKVVWHRGSQQEYDQLCRQLMQEGVFTPLNPQEYPNCFWARSAQNDVARVEDRTFVCSRSQDDAGPLNLWRDPQAMYRQMRELMNGCMKGRTMYVIPYLMGPARSPYARVGFELTDSPYVVANMHIMARCGDVALDALGPSSDAFVRGVHSMGSIDLENRYICHFPEDKTIISFNSNYGGNALLGKKCFALRIASSWGREQGWMAEHMLILGITNPKGVKRYFCAAFPSACGKTNLAMLIPPKNYLDEGWKVQTVGDDIAWLSFGRDGRLYAINPEAGFFGVAPGTSEKTNPNAMATLRANTLFTNTALDLDRMTPWWEGMGTPPARAKDWLGNDWTPASKTKAAHPNSRFTAPARQCPSIDPEWESAGGVPVSAIIFGGRRARTAPLVYEAMNWQHGTFVGATMASETTTAAGGEVGKLRRDPMAMRPFLGYHVGDYFRHWLNLGRRGGDKMPRLYHVNWFRTSPDGKFLWPGFGDNMRVLEWIFNRVEGRASAMTTPLGYQPKPSDLRIDGLSVGPRELEELLAVHPEDWGTDLESQREFFEEIGPKLPVEILEEYDALCARLGLASAPVPPPRRDIHLGSHAG